MKVSLILIATASLLVVGGVSAEAGCVNPLAKQGVTAKMPAVVLPQMSTSQPSGDDASGNVVGTWLVSYTVDGNDAGQAFTQWHSDGTEWETINYPVSSGNICMGSWKQLDAKHVYRYHVGWLYTDGNLSGYFVETETDKVTGKGTYAGHNEITIYGLDGAIQAHMNGTASATRITP